MDGKTILIIDDDVNLCKSLKIGLGRLGFSIITANNGKAGIRAMHQQEPDLVLLDIRMPEMNGWETCRQIRTLSNVPIIMLTSISDDKDIVRGLEYGADDFISKPFSREVLIARVRAILRRADVKAEIDDEMQNYHDDYLWINPVERRISLHGEPIKLSSTEFKLLMHLYKNAGQTVTYNSILTGVWGWDYQDNADYVHVYMSHLRRKIEQDPRNPVYLLTDHGIGYTFCRNDK